MWFGSLKELKHTNFYPQMIKIDKFYLLINILQYNNMGNNNSKVVPDNVTRILDNIYELNTKIQCLTDYANAFEFTEDVQKRYDQYNNQLRMAYIDLDYYIKNEEEKEQEKKEKRDKTIRDLRDLHKQLESHYTRSKSLKKSKPINE